MCPVSDMSQSVARYFVVTAIVASSLPIVRRGRTTAAVNRNDEDLDSKLPLSGRNSLRINRHRASSSLKRALDSCSIPSCFLFVVFIDLSLVGNFLRGNSFYSHLSE
jgi:hypothetical protein